MTTKNTFKVTLNKNEIWLLLSQFAPVTVCGIENPYHGWLYEDIVAESEKAAQNLEEAEWVHQAKDGGLMIHEGLQEMLEAIAHPESILILQGTTPEKSPVQKYGYLTPDQFVSLEAKGGETYHLESGAGIWGFVEPLISGVTENELNPHKVGMTLPEDALYKSAEYMARTQRAKAEEALAATQLSQSEQKALLDCLSDIHCNLALALLFHPMDEEQQDVRGFGVLAGSDYLWQIQPTESLGQPSAELIPVSLRELRDKIEQLTRS